MNVVGVLRLRRNRCDCLKFTFPVKDRQSVRNSIPYTSLLCSQSGLTRAGTSKFGPRLAYSESQSQSQLTLNRSEFSALRKTGELIFGALPIQPLSRFPGVFPLEKDRRYHCGDFRNHKRGGSLMALFLIIAIPSTSLCSLTCLLPKRHQTSHQVLGAWI